MKIFAGHDGGSGCMWYRVELPMRQLEKHGHDVTFRSMGDEPGHKPVTLKDLDGYDVILAQRFNTHRGLEPWRRSRTPFSRLVYETDDDSFTVASVNFQAFHVYSRPEVRDAIEHGAQVADLITVTTEHLAGVMRERTGNPNIAVLPNYLPRFALDLPRARGDRPAVGWQGGASHGVDVGLVVGPVRRFLQRFPGWNLRLGGTDYRPTFRAGQQAVFTKWVPVYENPAGYYASIDFDIGLAPLAMTEFDYSKSNVKILEYASRGIPAIATDCEVYRSFIRHGENGFLVKQDHEWLKYMSALASDSALRQKMGQQARQDAAAWLIEDHYVKWEQAYEALFKSRSDAVS